MGECTVAMPDATVENSGDSPVSPMHYAGTNGPETSVTAYVTSTTAEVVWTTTCVNMAHNYPGAFVPKVRVCSLADKYVVKTKDYTGDAGIGGGYENFLRKTWTGNASAV